MIIKNETSSISQQHLLVCYLPNMPEAKRIQVGHEIEVTSGSDGDLRFTKTQNSDDLNLIVTGYDIEDQVQWSETWLVGNRERNIDLTNTYYNVHKIVITSEME